MTEDRTGWREAMKRHLGPGLRRMLEDRPGRRFVRYYRLHRGGRRGDWTRLWQIALGWALIVAGLVLWIAPVLPGLFLTVPGLALLSLQSKKLSRVLDRSELGLRRTFPLFPHFPLSRAREKSAAGK